MGKMKELDYTIRATAKDLGISYRELRDCAEELSEAEDISLHKAIERICGGC